MSLGTNGNTMLYELAQGLSSREGYPAAIALRKLIQAGYTTLEQVAETSDWVLLATPGMGPGRLGAVRRLIRPDWQPPPAKVIRAGERFLSAARFALRFWPVETLELVVRDPASCSAAVQPAEKRLAMVLFAEAARRASRHGDVEQLVAALWQVSDGQDEILAAGGPKVPVHESRLGRDSSHFAFSPEHRREIVEHFRAARTKRQIANKDSWARTHYNISARTLLRYEREFSEIAQGR